MIYYSVYIYGHDIFWYISMRPAKPRGPLRAIEQRYTCRSSASTGCTASCLGTTKRADHRRVACRGTFGAPYISSRLRTLATVWPILR